jgi:structural maintenance of chromosome 3 (chondroitin sulfate proteoglycan 6)
MSPCCVQWVDSNDVEHFLFVFKQNALLLIHKLKYAQGYVKAMQYVFGRTVLCRNMTCVLNFTDESDFDCITLDGDQVSVLKSIIYIQ